MNIIRLNSRDDCNWQTDSIANSLSKLNYQYTIGLIDRVSDSVCNDINVCNNVVSEVDIILALRCDHVYDYHTRSLEEELHQIYVNKPIIFIKSTNTNYGKFKSIDYPIWFTIIINELQKEKFKLHQSSGHYTPKKYLYSCLNNKMYEARIANYIEFLKSNYYNKSLITANNVITNTDYILDYLGRRWNDYNQIFLTQVMPNLPVTSADISPLNDTNIFRYDNSAYFDSYVNIVTENSYIEKPFITEKTIKCILAEQFFVIVGGKNSIQYLRDLGFDTYDDIIDHNVYDDSDEIDRIINVHKLLNDMQHYNWDQIYKDTKERRQFNKQKVLNLDIEQKFLNELMENIYDILQF